MRARGGGLPAAEPGAGPILSTGAAIALVGLGSLATASVASGTLAVGYEYLGAGAGWSAFSWASSAAIFAAGLGVLLLAAFLPARRARLLLIGLLLASLSFAAMGGLQQPSAAPPQAQLPVPRTVTDLFWPAFYPVAVGLVFAVLWPFAAELPGRTRRALRVGLLHLAAAVFAGATYRIWHQGHGAPGDWPEHVPLTLQKGVELSAWVLIASSLIGAVSLSRARSEPEHKEGVKSLLVLGLLLAGSVGAVHAAAELTNFLFFENRFNGLNVDAERNVFAWASSVATAAAAVISFWLASLVPRARRRFVLLGLVLAYFSLDDAVVIHERLGSLVAIDRPFEGIWRLVGVPHEFGGIWPAVYLPLLAYAFCLVWIVSRELESESRRAVRLGLSLLAVGVGAEVVHSMLNFGLSRQFAGWPRHLEVSIEEALEIAGWILVGLGLATGACGKVGRLGQRGKPAAAAGSGRLPLSARGVG